MYKAEQDSILENIVTARRLLKKVKVSRDIMEIIAYVCMEMGVDGHRADIAILKTSKTIAACHHLEEVNTDHVEEAALLVLGERLHKASQNKNKINQMVQKALEDISKKKEEKENPKKDESEKGQNQPGGIMQFKIKEVLKMGMEIRKKSQKKRIMSIRIILNRIPARKMKIRGMGDKSK